MATQDRVLIRDTDHLAHFASDLSASWSSKAYADVVIRCAPPNVAEQKAKEDAGAVKKASVESFPTLRVHRAVIASVSDFLGKLIRDCPIEEDVHITIDQTSMEVFQLIAQFAYVGEVKIPKHTVTAVCDAAHRLQIKFLKDSFVKVTDKDYAAMKAGKKSLETIQKESKIVSEPNANPRSQSNLSQLPSPSKKKVVKISTKTSGKSSDKLDAQNKKRDSDTDSADSDNESKAIKVPATKKKDATTKKETRKKEDSKKTESVMFTLTKQVEDNSTQKVSEKGTFLVHFNQKTSNGSPVAQSTSAQIPSPVASIQQPLPPSALPKVKKVMIPPMIRKTVGIALSKPSSTTAPTFTIASPGGNTQRLASPQSLGGRYVKLQTVKQPDGTTIQILKPTEGPPGSQSGIKLITTGQSNTVPKDALALAMQAISGRPSSSTGLVSSSSKTPIAIQLPKSPVPITKVTLPTAPLPQSSIGVAGKSQAVSNVKSIKKVVISPQKKTAPLTVGGGKIVVASNQANNTSTVSPSSSLLSVGPTTPVKPAPVSGQHGITRPPMGIPSTVPDDFLEVPEEKSSSGNGNESSTKKAGKVSAKDTTKSKSKGVSLNKKAQSADKKAEKDASKESKQKGSDDHNRTLEDQSVRSSTRVRKTNPKYQVDNEGKSSEEVSSIKGESVAKKSLEKSTPSQPQRNAKRKSNIVDDTESGPAKKTKPQRTSSSTLKQLVEDAKAIAASPGERRTRGKPQTAQNENATTSSKRQRRR